MTPGPTGSSSPSTSPAAEPPVLTYAGGRYARTAAVLDGTATHPAVRLDARELSPGALFVRQLRTREFDVAEMSLSAHILAVSRGERDLVGVPVFPSRAFRHSAVYVRTDSRLTGLAELRGRRVGVPEYHMTAALFLRGVLADDHGIGAGDVRWVQAGLTEPGRRERVALHLPPGIDLTVRPDESLTDLLRAGAIDAIVSPIAPWPPDGRGAGFRRLLADPRTAERDWFARTGIFPIMHLLVVRREVAARYPWLAGALVELFTAAKEAAEADGLAHDPGVIGALLPWQALEIDTVLATMGREFWPYGVAANRTTLAAACRYSAAQGLAARRVEVDELFG